MKILVLRFLDLALGEIAGPNGKFTHDQFIEHLLELEAVTENDDMRGDPVWVKYNKRNPICTDLLMIRMGFGADHLRECKMIDRVFSLSEFTDWEVSDTLQSRHFKVISRYMGDDEDGDEAAVISIILHKLITPLNLMNFIVRFQSTFQNENGA